MIYKIYRISNILHERGIPFIPRIISLFLRVVFSCDIPASCKISKGTRFAHGGLGVVLHSRTQIGENCTIYQHVTIGGNGKGLKNLNGVPVIGNNVKVYVGSVIMGPVTIGDNAIIGANTIINKSVPSNCTAVGNPMKILNHN